MSLADRLRARVAPVFSDEMRPYDPCHDLFHVDRVARNARLLARAEGADEEVCAAAAYLHDLDRAGEKDPLGAAREHLRAAGADEGTAARVLEVVERHKDKAFAPGGKRARSLEARVLSDADKLEAIGAIGIGRAFSFGGLQGRALWGGRTRPPGSSPWGIIDELLADASTRPYVSGASGSTIDHFFEKLLRLQNDLDTPAGRRMGEERTAFLRTFLAQFFREWDAMP